MRDPISKENPSTPSKGGQNAKRKVEEEPWEKEGHGKNKYQVNMEIFRMKEDLNAKEHIMKHLLNEWRNLEERFIPEDQNFLYKEKS